MSTVAGVGFSDHRNPAQAGKDAVLKALAKTGTDIWLTRCDKELIRTLQEEIGAEIPWLGFYTYGEIGPIRQTNCFHNFTTVLVAVY